MFPSFGLRRLTRCAVPTACTGLPLGLSCLIAAQLCCMDSATWSWQSSSYMIASNLETYRKLVPVFQAFAAGEALIFAFQLLSGMHTFAEVGPPTIIWAVFMTLLLVFGRNRPAPV